jgi:cytochrome c peroxidase
LGWIVGCGGDDNPIAPPSDEIAQTIAQFELSALPPIPYPDDNHFLAERVALGRLLFFDPILGGESDPALKQAAGKDPYRYRANDVACATCHHPAFNFADGRRLGAGVSGAQFNDLDLGPARVVPGLSLVTGDPVGTEPRNSMTILNAAFNGEGSITPVADSFQFMDGRVTDGLEGQAILPLTSREEMAGDAYGPGATVQDAQDAVTQRIRNIPEYVMRFRQAFASEINDAADITIQHIGRAIAAYERELITPNSRYDQFVSGDYSVFTQQEKDGFTLFFGKGLCGDCHRGPMLSDFEFVVQGVGDDYDSILPGFPGKNGVGGDWGRFHADELAFADQKFAFRTLTIRDVELTAPYFHSGSAGTLMEVLQFYNRGGRGPQDISDAEMTAAGVTRDPSIRPLGLTGAEMEAIVAFLKTTTATVQLASLGINLTEVPQRVPSGLVPPGIPTPSGPGPFLTTYEVARN